MRLVWTQIRSKVERPADGAIPEYDLAELVEDDDVGGPTPGL
jgi:hypothetical protein